MPETVAVVGCYETRQQRRLQDQTATELVFEAVDGALADAGLTTDDVDGVAAEWLGPGGNEVTPGAADWARQLGSTLTWISDTFPAGPIAMADAAAAIRDGRCSTVVIAGGQGDLLPPPGQSVAGYTRFENEFIGMWGATTPTEFALVAQRHMDIYGTTPEQIAGVAATIRNHGHRNPNAVMYGRGPYTVEDILSSPMVSSPLHRLELPLVSAGAAAIVVTNRHQNVRSRPVYLLAGATEYRSSAYVNPPIYEEVGRIGEDIADRVFERSGLIREDIDLFQLYDTSAFEVIRQFEVLGYCKEGEGGPFVADGRISIGGSHPVCTDGGVLSHGALGRAQMTQKVIEAVQQLRGESEDRQVADARTALVGAGGPPVGFYSLAILGLEQA